MSAGDMAIESPKACDKGMKRDVKGCKESWQDRKARIDAAIGDIPACKLPLTRLPT